MSGNRRNSASQKKTLETKTKKSPSVSACESEKHNSPTKCGSIHCEEFVNDDEDAIECWSCNEWFHRKCTNLSTLEFDSLVKLQNLHWICEKCQEGDKSTKNDVKEMKKSIDSLKNVMQEILVKMTRMEEEKSKLNETVKSMVKKEVEEVMGEYKEEEKRKNNSIISGLPEIFPENSQEKNEIDNFLKFLKNDQVKKEDVIDAFRLGKPREDKKPRILKIVFRNQESKRSTVKDIINKNKNQKDQSKKSRHKR